jgi:phthiocerol/phenolphthiocerol synthesis type-I polyketide synthase E
MSEGTDPDYEAFILHEVAELTGNPSVSLDDSFLQLGGDSLKAILLASAIEERFDIAIDIVDVFQSETFRELSQLVADVAARTASERLS